MFFQDVLPLASRFRHFGTCHHFPLHFTNFHTIFSSIFLYVYQLFQTLWLFSSNFHFILLSSTFNQFHYFLLIFTNFQHIPLLFSTILPPLSAICAPFFRCKYSIIQKNSSPFDISIVLRNQTSVFWNFWKITWCGVKWRKHGEETVEYCWKVVERLGRKQ